MAQNHRLNLDPFTFDLFNDTALSSSLNLGVMAFADDVAANDDDDPEPTPPSPAQRITPSAPQPSSLCQSVNFVLDGDRGLAANWKDRARDSIAAIRLAARIEAEERPATSDEQRALIRFTGFGASDLANGVFPRPGKTAFRKGWETIGDALQDAVSDADYASLARCTQYAHFTPEFIVQAIWAGLQRLGWRGGRVLEPGTGTGLFAALMPEAFRDCTHVTGVELDPTTARIARLLQPRARILTGDFARAELPASFDLAIGNPPFSDRAVRSDRAYRSMGLRLNDYFIARSIDLLKSGGFAAFVTSHGTMDKADAAAREHIASSADLIAAIRLPQGSFWARTRSLDIVRLHPRAGQFPLDGSSKGRCRSRSPRRRQPQRRHARVADPLRVDRGRSGTGPGRHRIRAGLRCSRWTWLHGNDAFRREQPGRRVLLVGVTRLVSASAAYCLPWVVAVRCGRSPGRSPDLRSAPPLRP